MKPAEVSIGPPDQLLQEVIQFVPAGLFQISFDESGNSRFHYLSEGFETLTGYEVEELLAHPGIFKLIINEEDYELTYLAWEESRRQNIACSFDYRITTKGGEQRWLRSSSVPTQTDDGDTRWNGFTIDVSAEKIAERRSREAEELLRDLTESLPGVVSRIEIEWGKPSRYSYINSHVQEVFGLTREQALAPGGCDRITRMIDKQEIPRIMRDFADLMQSQQSVPRPTVNEYSIHREDGVSRRIRSSATLRKEEKGGVTFNYVEDVTDEYEVRQQLAEAKQAAEAASRAKSEFLANMSHEIRTPMNAIVGLAQLGLGVREPDKIQDYLHKINQAAQSLLGIINDILDFSKIEAGKLTLERTPFDLNEVINGVINLLSGPAAEKGLTLKVEMTPDLPAALFGDPLRLGQVLLNLAGNAVKFTQSGSVTLRVSHATDSSSNLQLRFEVADTGIGMEQTQLEQLFDAFAQADSSTSRQYGGTGLGMTISQRLVTLMGGRIQAQSEPGKGSVFEFSVNFEAADVAELAGANVTGGTQVMPQPILELKVLVVEDNELNQLVAQDLLTSLGIEVTLADSGQAAITLATEQDFDLILMDVQMPGMDGYETTVAIRALNTASAQLPIIAMTANAMAEDREQCLAAGMDDYLPKPIDHKQLAALLTRWAGRRSTWQPEPAPPSSVSKDDVTDMPDYDFAAAERRLGSRKLLRELARRFVADDGLRFRLNDQLEAGDTAAALITAHSLKSVAGTVGATALRDCAAELERALKTGASYELLFQRVCVKHNVAIRELDAFLDAS